MFLLPCGFKWEKSGNVLPSAASSLPHPQKSYPLQMAGGMGGACLPPFHFCPSRPSPWSPSHHLLADQRGSLHRPLTLYTFEETLLNLPTSCNEGQAHPAEQRVSGLGMRLVLIYIFFLFCFVFQEAQDDASVSFCCLQLSAAFLSFYGSFYD